MYRFWAADCLRGQEGNEMASVDDSDNTSADSNDESVSDDGNDGNIILADVEQKMVDLEAKVIHLEWRIQQCDHAFVAQSHHQSSPINVHVLRLHHKVLKVEAVMDAMQTKLMLLQPEGDTAEQYVSKRKQYDTMYENSVSDNKIAKWIKEMDEMEPKIEEIQQQFALPATLQGEPLPNHIDRLNVQLDEMLSRATTVQGRLATLPQPEAARAAPVEARYVLPSPTTPRYNMKRRVIQVNSHFKALKRKVDLETLSETAEESNSYKIMEMYDNTARIEQGLDILNNKVASLLPAENANHAP